jgi:hypothetical protein
MLLADTRKHKAVGQTLLRPEAHVILSVSYKMINISEMVNKGVAARRFSDG